MSTPRGTYPGSPEDYLPYCGHTQTRFTMREGVDEIGHYLEVKCSCGATNTSSIPAPPPRPLLAIRWEGSS